MDKRPIDNQPVPIDNMQRYRGLLAEIRELEYRAAEREELAEQEPLAHARV